MSDRQTVRDKMPIIAWGITASDYAALKVMLDGILHALSIHPLMADPPSSQITPAPLFHIYDFIDRTRSNLGRIAVAKLSANETDALEKWNDCVGRCGMARLMVDNENGKAAELLGGQFEFGEGVRKAVVRAAVVAGNAGSTVDGAVGRINSNVTGKQRGRRSGKKT